jgi:zinc transport system ATP-binding protein
MTGHLVARQPGAPASYRFIVDAMASVLEVSDLAIRFGSAVVFHGLSFSVPAGSSLAVIGPNGAGKTVLFKALVGSLPYEGRVRWAPGVRIGYVPQRLDLDRDLPITGHDLLRAKAGVTQGAGDIADATAAVGLGAELDRRIGALSGGQFQRLLVAMAMVGHPNVLLLDEPTAGIDEPGQERLNELVARLRRERGLTSLVISHELSVVFHHATAVLCLGGDRSWFGAPTEILTPERLREIYGPVDYHVHA